MVIDNLKINKVNFASIFTYAVYAFLNYIWKLFWRLKMRARLTLYYTFPPAINSTLGMVSKSRPHGESEGAGLPQSNASSRATLIYSSNSSRLVWDKIPLPMSVCTFVSIYFESKCSRARFIILSFINIKCLCIHISSACYLNAVHLDSIHIHTCARITYALPDCLTVIYSISYMNSFLVVFLCNSFRLRGDSVVQLCFAIEMWIMKARFNLNEWLYSWNKT